MKKIVDSNPEPETPKAETIPNPDMTVSQGGGEKPKTMDKTTLIVVVIVIVIVIGLMIYFNMKKANGNTGTTDPTK